MARVLDFILSIFHKGGKEGVLGSQPYHLIPDDCFRFFISKIYFLPIALSYDYYYF